MISDGAEVVLDGTADKGKVRDKADYRELGVYLIIKRQLPVDAYWKVGNQNMIRPWPPDLLRSTLHLLDYIPARGNQRLGDMRQPFSACIA